MSEENNTSSGVQVSEELLAMANGGLYRNNLFRILAIPVKAGPAEVRQRQKRLEMQRKLGLVADGGAGGGLFPMDPPPTTETATKAIERMNDPVARFLDEFFWFSAPDGDVGIAALERGNVGAARESWQQMVAGSRSAVHALHNLAVMDHLLALESPSPNGHASSALAAWKETLAEEAFWDRVRARIGEMNDVRLTTGFARRLRHSLPSMVVLSFARQAVAAAEQGDAKGAQAVLAVIRQSGYGDDVVDAVMREALTPLRSRISAAVASAKNRWTKKPHHGDRIIRELYEAVHPLLTVHDLVVDNDIARQGVHDEVAEAMNLAEVAYCKATNNWAEGAKLLAIAKGIAIGQRLQDQISDNIRIDQENIKSGNDWCAPGYWDLTPEVIAELEKARTHAEAGSFDAALEILLAMDKEIGFPLVRAAAHCMSIKAIRKFNEAIGEFNAESGVLKTLMDNIRNKNSATIMALCQPPQPTMNTWQLPSCPVCGSSHYTSWTNFRLKELPMWMCSSCSSRHNSDVESKKRTFLGAISEPMQYLALASRFDPKDPGILRNKEGIEKTARDCGYYGTPDAEALAAKLTKNRTYRMPVNLGTSASGTCFFCGVRPGVESCAIAVPMHGPVKKVKFLLGSGVSCEYGDVYVPRCADCHRHHSEWPERIEAWHEAALDAGGANRFPEQAEVEASAKQNVEALSKGLELSGLSVGRARVAVDRAIESQGFMARLLRRPNPARAAADTALAAAERQSRMAGEWLAAATDEHKRAHRELKELRQKAVAAYKAAHPAPSLPEGIRPENDVTQAEVIASQLGKSWFLGDSPESDGKEVAPKGTVSRTPRLRDLDQPSHKAAKKEDGGKSKDGKDPKPPPMPKSQGNWSKIKLCGSCGKGNPEDVSICVNCGKKC